MAFKMRTSKPGAGNKYYITKAKGGYSNAIEGNPTDKDCNVLSNCVGYAYGRFNEIGGYGYCKYLCPTNAERFIEFKGSCEVGMIPKVGACMVWQKGATLSGSDGAGHVAIVEKVVSSTEVITSESGWGYSNPFWNSTRKKGSGNWGAGAGYKFLGFIYNPAVKEEDNEPEVSIVNPVSRDTSKNQIQVKIDDLYVRTGPMPTDTNLGFIKKGYYNYSETKTTNGYTWYKIGKSNWIASNPEWTTVYKASKPTSKITSPVAKNDSKDQIQVRVDDLRVRTSAGTSSAILGFVKKGYYNYTEMKSSNGYSWYKIAEGNWIASNPEWTTVHKAKPEPTMTSPVKRDTSKNQIQIKIPNLRVRTAAGDTKPILGLAKKGYYNYTQTEKANGYTWYKIAESNWVAYSASWITILDVVKETIHIVKSGESFWSIADKYGVDYKKLAEYNNLKVTDIIYKGQKLKVPAK